MEKMFLTAQPNFTLIANKLNRARRSNPDTFDERQAAFTRAICTNKLVAKIMTDESERRSVYSANRSLNYSLARLFLERARQMDVRNADVVGFGYSAFYVWRAMAHRKEAQKLGRMLRP